MRATVILVESYGEEFSVWTRPFDAWEHRKVRKSLLPIRNEKISPVRLVKQHLRKNLFRRQKTICLKHLFSSLETAVVWFDSSGSISVVHSLL